MQEMLNPSFFSYLPVFLIRILSFQIPLRFILVRDNTFVFSNIVAFTRCCFERPYDLPPFAKAMIRHFRNLFLPSVAFLIIGGLAWGEWSKVIRFKKAAYEFQKNSDIRFFSYAGDKQWEGRLFPTYEYEVDGEIIEFPTHKRVMLPMDGKVRIGLDPLPHMRSSFVQLPRDEMFIPMDGPDTVETVYKGLRGHEIEQDYKKASLVSVAALIAGITGFFLQRIILREVRRAVRGR